MTVYISPNPGKEQAADTARRAAQLLLMQGAVVLMRDEPERVLLMWKVYSTLLWKNAFRAPMSS